MEEHERVVLACAIMRQLEELWRARWGLPSGEKPFSVWYLLLATAVFLGPPGADSIGNVTDKRLKELRLRMGERPAKSSTAFAGGELAEAPYPAFLLAVLDVLLTLVRARKEVGVHERDFLGHAITLLTPWRGKKKQGSKLEKILRPPSYRFGRPLSVGRLLEEGLRRVLARRKEHAL